VASQQTFWVLAPPRWFVHRQAQTETPSGPLTRLACLGPDGTADHGHSVLMSKEGAVRGRGLTSQVARWSSASRSRPSSPSTGEGLTRSLRVLHEARTTTNSPNGTDRGEPRSGQRGRTARWRRSRRPILVEDGVEAARGDPKARTVQLVGRVDRRPLRAPVPGGQ
jgi:hypothetical protein